MPDRILQDCRVLVVEDEYMLADNLATELSDAGAFIIGPVATVEAAFALIAAESEIDGAVLDVNLGGEMVFPVADLLLKRQVPFIFTTGYDLAAFPLRFERSIRCEKPTDMRIVTRAIGRVVHG